MNSSGGTPPGPDPNLTQPLPPVGRVRQPRTSGPRPASSAPTYGNVAVYLLGRLAAFLVDVPGLAFVAASFAYGQFRLDSRPAAYAGYQSFGFIASASLLGALVFAMLCEGVVGTTVGKALFMLHVSRVRGGYAGLGRAVVRALVRPVDLLAIGPLLAAVTPRHQRLGDFAAGTTVARSPAGVFAPVAAVVLLGGLVYAEFAVGGGLDSAISVAVETSSYAPTWKDDVLALFGGLAPHPAGAPVSAPSATPGPDGTPAPATSPGPQATSAESDATFPPGSAATASATGGASPAPEASDPFEEATPAGPGASPAAAPSGSGTTPV